MSKLKQSAINLVVVLGIVALIGLFDAVFGGIISSGLSSDSEWSAYDQRVNDGYQLLLGSMVLAGLILQMWFREFDRNIVIFALAIFLLLAGYVEDAMYYIWLSITQYPIEFFGQGLLEVETGFPERIAGWIGWIARNWLRLPFDGFEISAVVLMNFISIAGVFVLFYLFEREKERERKIDGVMKAIFSDEDTDA